MQGEGVEGRRLGVGGEGGYRGRSCCPSESLLPRGLSRLPRNPHGVSELQKVTRSWALIKARLHGDANPLLGLLRKRSILVKRQNSQLKASA